MIRVCDCKKNALPHSLRRPSYDACTGYEDSDDLAHCGRRLATRRALGLPLHAADPCVNY
jgi:hypothetical protein